MRRRTARLLLPRIPLSLIKKTETRHRDEFLHAAGVVGVVGLSFSAQADAGGVVPVVVPERVDAELFDQANVLRFIFGVEIDLAYGDAARTCGDVAAVDRSL